MARAWLGPWVWKAADSAGPAWGPPTGATVGLDLRRLTHQAQVGPVASGHGCFLTPDAVALGAGYLEIQPTLNASRRTAIQNFLGLPDAVTALTRPGMLVDLLTRHATADGDTFARPLMPERDGNIRFTFGDATLTHFLETTSPYWLKVQRVYQEDYRKIRLRVLAQLAPENFHRKWLGMLVRKHPTIPWQNFIPNDLPTEEPMEPSTTLTDNFNRADQNGWGTASGGFSWLVDETNFDILSNQGRIKGGAPAGIRAESDLSGADHFCQYTIVNAGNAYAGPVTRFAAAAQTFYNAFALNGGSDMRLCKVVAGSRTDLTSGAHALANGDVLKCEINGTTLKGYIGGVEKLSVTDSAISSNTRAGAAGISISTPLAVDTWSAEDLGGGAAATYPGADGCGVF